MRRFKKNMKKPLVIILLGSPGSGKGTQAELLSEKLDLYYLETSKIIERNIMEAKKGSYVAVDGEKYPLLKEKKLWQTGFLCSPPLVTFWIKNKIKELFREKKGILMAGSPRTLFEAKELIPFLKRKYDKNNIKVVLINISAKESIFRNSHRRICQLMRHPILYIKETQKLTKCPLDGSKLIKRKGLDNPETIKVRLREYKKRTLPIIAFFKKQGLKVKKINGSPPPANVFKEILRKIK